MYSRNYKRDSIKVPDNYGGVAFDKEDECNMCNQECEEHLCEEDACLKNDYIEEKPQCESECPKKEEGLFDGIKHILSDFNLFSEGSELLILFIIFLLQGDNRVNVNELKLVLFFLLTLK